MPTRKAQFPAVRITLANGASVVAGRHSLAKLLELTFSGRPQPVPQPVRARPAAKVAGARKGTTAARRPRPAA
jgi:hypothetical protein